jgi:hypothetical protein
MVQKWFPKRIGQKAGFFFLVAVISLWIVSQAVGQVSASAAREVVFSERVIEEADASTETVGEPAMPVSPAQAAASETEEVPGWFLVDETSHWSDDEMVVVEEIMARTWAALDNIGLDGQNLLEGYRFRRAAAEFVPGGERLLAVVDHQHMEIVLADGAFKRLHGFYIYHELGHAIDHRLERLPSEAYHRLASQGQEEAAEAGDKWSTTDGFWLRYPGRDHREEATADAIAWWVMSQASQPKPFFAGTPLTADYDGIAQTIEAALLEAVASN